MGKYQWSPQLQKLRDKLRYLQLSLSRKRGCHVGARLLMTLSKQVNISVIAWSTSKIEKEIYETTAKFKFEEKSKENE